MFGQSRPDTPGVGQSPSADPGGTSKETACHRSQHVQSNWIDSSSRRVVGRGLHCESSLEDPLAAASGILTGIALGCMIWALLIVNLII